MRIGVIADTHGYMDPRVPPVFHGVDHIFHAGDIGPYSILAELEFIAPVTAVLGNTDGPLPGIRETEFIRVGPLGFLVHHIVDPERPDDVVRRRLELNQPQVVIFGHTHKPFSRWLHETLYFNPGYAGRQRFDLKRSVAVLHIDGPTAAIREELIWL